MTHQLIIALAAIFALFRLSKTTDKFANAISFGLIFSVALTLVQIRFVSIAGFVLFMLCLVLVIIYGFKKENLSKFKKPLIVIPAFFVFALYFFQFQHYPYAGAIGLAMIIPVLCYIFLLTRFKSFKNELGFMTIIVAAAAIEVARRFDWLMN
ncbi:hypothetical protein [Halocola ammonii]